MSEEMRALFEERLGRYHAAMALEVPDRVPIAAQMNYLAESYSGYSKQEAIYDPQRCLQANLDFARTFPEVDALRSTRVWGPLFDTLGSKLYKLPGRDLLPDVQYQYVEDEYMKKDEYRLLIDDPISFLMDRYLPRILGEFSEKGSNRSYLAFLKGGMAFVMYGNLMKDRSLQLETQYGMPQPISGGTLAPFDFLADGLRGLKAVILDMYRQPDNVLEACDSLVHVAVNAGLGAADPQRRYPIFIPFHKACFLTPKQFDQFYWPSLKKMMLRLIEAGYPLRVFLEGNWAPHWHHMLELPKGSVVCDLDNENDIFKAKEEIGHHQCIGGGMPDSLLILGTPEEVRERVKLLCETVGKDGGFIINGGSGIPYNTKIENYRAMIDAVMEYGVYDQNIKPKPRIPYLPGNGTDPREPRMLTPWSAKRAELGEILGDEDLIRQPWEMLEAMSYSWLWMWAQC